MHSENHMNNRSKLPCTMFFPTETSNLTEQTSQMTTIYECQENILRIIYVHFFTELFSENLSVWGHNRRTHLILSVYESVCASVIVFEGSKNTIIN